MTAINISIHGGMELLKLMLRFRAEELSVWVELVGGVSAEVEAGKGSLVTAVADAAGKGSLLVHAACAALENWELREGLCK